MPLTLDIPLTADEQVALERLAAAVPLPLPEYVALVLREVLKDTDDPHRPNLG